jgi:4-amino-4-deoxy-L-arabinose transferase-like glycosyltransferase
MWRRVSPTWMLLGLVLAAIFVRVAYVWTLPADHLQWSDEQEFDEIAWRLASTGRYESAPYRATPALPWFLAAVYRVTGHSYRAVRVAQSVSAGIIVLAVYGIGASLFTRATGFVAAVGAAFYPPLIYLSGVLYAEHLFTVLLLSTVFGFVKWWQTHQLRWVVMAGVGLGLGALCRPVFLAFAPLAAAYVGWAVQARLRWQSIAVLVAAVCMIVCPWTVRNAVTFHHFVPISTGLGLHLWRGNNDVSRGDADDRLLLPGGGMLRQRINELPSNEQREAALAEERDLEVALMQTARVASAPSNRWDLVTFDHVLQSAGTKWMAYHPGDVLWLSGMRMLSLYSAFTRTNTPTEDASRRNKIIAGISFYPVLVLGLIGAVVAWHTQPASVVVHAAILAGTVVYLLTTACTRFRLPLDPLWILLASVTVMWASDKGRVKVTSTWGSLWEKPESPSQAPLP